MQSLITDILPVSSKGGSNWDGSSFSEETLLNLQPFLRSMLESRSLVMESGFKVGGVPPI